jgi:RNA polymerase subunit RPABC4/transcription elongation factor Spt4
LERKILSAHSFLHFGHKGYSGFSIVRPESQKIGYEFNAAFKLSALVPAP